MHPFTEIIERQGVVVLDGGLATALEAEGFDLDDELWSAKVLLSDPDAIRRVHLSFLAAGADCITASTYQASLPGFRKKGFSDEAGGDLLRLSVQLALDAREEFWSDESNRAGRLRPIVAASVGPYGAYLADASEYTGDYGVDERALYAFHRARWNILAGTGADLLACETIPSRVEAGVLLRLLRETRGAWAWMSFSCSDGKHIRDGSEFAEVARACDDEARVVAVGVNCTSPRYVSELIDRARAVTRKPVLVYPNSGERYDRATRTWVDEVEGVDWGVAAAEWKRRRADGIGGCCRVTADDIAAMRSRLLPGSEGG